MKHKKLLLAILAVCLTVLLAVSIVACNPDGDKDDPQNKDPNQYEVAKYTVTFNTDSKDMVLANSVLRDVPSGTYIKAPADKDGNKIIPIKKGYTFSHWTADAGNKKEFVFSSTPITSNLTLTAVYTNNIYTHTADLRAKLVYDEGTKTFSVEKNARPEGEVSLSASETGSTTTLISTYASSSGDLPCPQSSDNDNKFCFWYYIGDDGMPVQFSKWKAEGDATVKHLTAYYFTNENAEDEKNGKGLTLYPMFTDNLPKVTVKYLDSKDDSELFASEQYVFGKNIADTEQPKPQKDNYKFEYWYYVVENKDKDGNVTYENEPFVFDDGGKDTKPTSPMDVAGAENNFVPVELKLYAKWTKELVITSEAEFKAWLYDNIRKQDPTDEEKKNIEELLVANIVIKGSLELTGTYEPLFDRDHTFKGTVEGKSADGSNVKAKISGGTFGNADSASVFGYVDGTIKNVDFENIGLVPTGEVADNVYIGVIATDNSGIIENCNVTLNEAFAVTGLKNATVGGIVAKNHGNGKRNGVVRKCSVKMVGATLICETLTFGGVAGESDASASIVNNTVDITVLKAECAGAYLNMGGLVGISASATRLNKVQLTVEELSCAKALVFGGVAGTNNGSVATTVATVSLCSKSVPAKASGTISAPVAIGGMFGKNEGYVLDSHVTANLYVSVEESQSANLYIGGIVGSNYSDKKDTNTSTEMGVCVLKYCYSMGEIDVTVADTSEGVTVYAGGIAGRNSHKKLSSLFSTVAVKVANDGENRLGHIVGAMVKDSGTNGKIFYDKDGAVTLVKDGQTHSIKGDGKGFEEYVDFENVGESADFSEGNGYHSADWVVGSEQVASSLGFMATKWEVKDGVPVLKDSVYEDRT